MRLLHTSDWHLGRSLHRADLREAQARFLDHLVEVVADERIDVVAVSGDVYDRAVPSVDAVELCEDGLVRLAATGARVVLISGNHDSASRLGFGNRLIDAAGVHLRTDPARVAEPVLLDDDHGPVAIYGLPYLEPDAVRDVLPPDPAGVVDPAGAPQDPGRGHPAVLGRAMDCVRADLAGRGRARSVVLAHAWVTGGEIAGSERDISVGGVGQAPTRLFDGVDYVALGHLHGPQVLSERARYSGSPLPYSFSEAGQTKGSWLVKLGRDRPGEAEFVPAPTYRRLAALRGRLDELLTSPAHEPHVADFLAVVLTDPVRPDDAMRRLQARFPHTLTLDWQPEGGRGDDGGSYAARVRGRVDLDVAMAFVEHVRRAPASADERALLAAAFEAGRRAGAAV